MALWCGIGAAYGNRHSGNGVHHDRLFNKICKEINTVSQLLSCKLTYTLVGDYYIPNIALPEENRPIGRWFPIWIRRSLEPLPYIRMMPSARFTS